LPERGFFLSLFVVWMVIFQFLGNSQSIPVKSPSLFQWMWASWNVDTLDSSHGKLIIPLVLGLLWWKRKEVMASIKGIWWPALIPLTMSVLIHVAGFINQQTRISLIAFFLGLYSIVGLAWGWKTMKTVFFPFVMFAFCMPLGTFIDPLTAGLRIMSTIITAFITSDLLGVPVVRMGTQLIDASNHYNYDVAAACSGIRSLFGLLAITLVFAMVLYKTYWRRAVMIGFAIPLAVICNTLRLVTIVLAAQSFGHEAGTFVHEWFGFVTYAISIAAIMLLTKFMREPQKNVSSIQ